MKKKYKERIWKKEISLHVQRKIKQILKEYQKNIL